MKGADKLRAEELRGIAAKLIELADEIDEEIALESRQSSRSPRGPSHSINGPSAEAMLRTAIKIYKFRQRRAKLFPGEIFGEPAWDIILDLFIARLNGRKISITSACIGSNVPSTTALRWIQLLGDYGILERTQNDFDRRGSFLKLSDAATRAMFELFERKLDWGGESTLDLFSIGPDQHASA
jgi:hypothetical protein